MNTSPQIITPRRKHDNFIHAVLQRHVPEGQFRSLAPLKGKILMSEIKAMSDWYTSSGLGFILPTVSTSAGIFNITNFSDYAKVCRHLGLPASRKLMRFDNAGDGWWWRNFGGDVEIVPSQPIEPASHPKSSESKEILDTLYADITKQPSGCSWMILIMLAAALYAAI